VPSDKAPIRLEDVSRAAFSLAGERDLVTAVNRFLEDLRGWAAPSAVLAAVRDPAAESGWRLLPALSAGSGPLGAERTLPQLVQEAPECLERPTLVRPREEVPGVRPRDNCVIPWWHEGESGLLVLRGVPRPCPPNLPEAVALLSLPMWPRLVGGPVERVEAGLAQIERVAQRLRDDTTRHIERLKAAQPAAPPPVDEGRVAALEQRLEAARLEVQGASAARDDLQARITELEKAREELAVSSRANDTALTMARRDLTDARQETQRATLELEDFRERVTALETTLRTTESERDRLGTELSARSAKDVNPADVDRFEKERAEAEERARALTEQQNEAETRARAAEDRRHDAEQRRQAADEALFKAREDLAAARADVERLTAEAAGGAERATSLEATLRAAEAERDRLRGEVERISSGVESKPGEGEAADQGASSRRLEDERRVLEQQARDAEERLREAERLRQAAEDAATRARQELAEARQGAQGSSLEIARLTDRLSAIEPSLKLVEAERDRGRGEIERLATRLESLRQDLATVTEQLEAQRRVAEAAGQDRGGAPGETVPRQAVAAGETPASSGAALSATAAVGALSGALSVLRRTPFVPPSLRVAMQEAEVLVAGGAEPVKPWLRVVLLDRDAASVEPLAAELEQAGMDVRIANYPEELALLMKTPDARELHAVVCDVLAFRADQNVAGLFRSWQKDRPSLALYLSFGTDKPTETERAKRVPLSLTAGRFGRPLIRQDVVDMLTPLAKRTETT